MTEKTLAFISPFALLLAADLWIASASAQHQGASTPKIVDQAVNTALCRDCHEPSKDLHSLGTQGTANCRGCHAKVVGHPANHTPRTRPGTDSPCNYHEDRFTEVALPQPHESQRINSLGEEIPPALYQIAGRTYYPLPPAQGFEEEGVASWYGLDFHGRRTSCGEIYNMHGLTAAHKTLPMHTWLLVKNLENDREVTVRVNDRGPFCMGRIIDLTRTAADSLGFLDRGTTRVKITVLADAENCRIDQESLAKLPNHPEFSD